MDLIILIEETVIHKTFGKGIIRGAYDKYLEIDFPEYGRKKFSYPSCFDGFLRLENEDKKRTVEEDLEQWKADNDIVKKEKCKQEYEKTQQAIRERQMAAAEKKKRAAQRTRALRSGYNRPTGGKQSK